MARQTSVAGSRLSIPLLSIPWAGFGTRQATVTHRLPIASGPMARWPDGPMARWPDGPMARWPDGPTARRPDGPTAQRILRRPTVEVDTRRVAETKATLSGPLSTRG